MVSGNSESSSETKSGTNGEAAGEGQPGEVWPQPLAAVRGPFSEARIAGAAEGMGDHGPATQALAAAGQVPPDLITGMTLFLLARQPRPATSDKSKPKKASAIAGGVWVREQFTIHRPLGTVDAFEVTGESTGRYVKKGRRYGTTRSQSHDSDGRLVASNLTTGLLSYKAEEGRADQVEGLPLEQTPGPDADWSAAADNPHLDALRTAEVGQTLGQESMVLSLAMMAARDTAQPDNPIHSDPEEARKAGLARPIAGGSHVLAFAIEPLLAAWGIEALSHGTKFDIRWRAPTEADVAIVPKAVVTAVEPDRVIVDVEVTLAGGPVAMVGTLTIPLPA
ncbi:MAG: MaoC family dehydratase [Acidimicrobiales bacterium]